MYVCMDAFSYCVSFVAACSLLCVHVASPSAELVKRVRELYTRNSSDVRFLIPVLHGLQKVGSLSHYQETTVDWEILNKNFCVPRSSKFF